MSIDDASAALSEPRYSLLVLGTTGDAGPHFMVANWATQASFDPWRYVVAVKKTARTLQYLEARQAFTVNLLAEDQDALVKDVMKKKGEGLPATKGALDAPRLEGAYAGWDCKVVDVLDVGGDHLLVVADVLDGWKTGDGPVLTLPELKLSYAG